MLPAYLIFLFVHLNGVWQRAMAKGVFVIPSGACRCQFLCTVIQQGGSLTATWTIVCRNSCAPRCGALWGLITAPALAALLVVDGVCFGNRGWQAHKSCIDVDRGQHAVLRGLPPATDQHQAASPTAVARRFGPTAEALCVYVGYRK